MPADTTPPNLINWTNLIGNPGKLLFIFDEAIGIGTGKIFLKTYGTDGSDGTVLETYTLTGVDTTNVFIDTNPNNPPYGLRINPDLTTSLILETDYVIEINYGAITDTAGNFFPDINSSSYTFTYTYTANYDYSTTPALNINLATDDASVRGTGAYWDVLIGIKNIIGGPLNDIMRGDGLANRMEGRGGNDTLDGRFGANGNDRLFGGLGDDTYIIDSSAEKLVEYEADPYPATPHSTVFGGTDTVKSSATWTLGTYFENLILTGNAAINGTGSALSNEITGNTANNVLNGAQGDDTINGGGGDDTVNGGLGRDTLILTGNNALNTTNFANISNIEVINLTLDQPTTDVTMAPPDSFVAAGGTFSLDGSVLTSGIIHFNGAAETDGTFNVLAGNGTDILTGGAGIDTLNGGGGNDTITGGGGNDVIDGGIGTDILDLSAATLGINFTLTQSTSSTNTGTLSGLGNDSYKNIEGVIGSNFDDTLTGSGSADLFIGGNGNDVLDGKDGADSLIGGSGDDVYIVYGANDVVTELAGGGNDTVRIAASYTTFDPLTFSTRFANVENLDLSLLPSIINGTPGNDNLTGTSGADIINGLAGNDTLAGDTGDDFLDGGAGTDVLNGNAGNDTLNGGIDSDTLTGGLGSDTFVFAVGDTVVTIGGTGTAGTISGYDVIQDFSNANGSSSSELLDLPGNATLAANTTRTNGADSTLNISSGSGKLVKSHRISNGLITFDDTNTFSAAVTVKSVADVAAVVQYLQLNDIGNAGATVAFNATIGGTAHTYIYTQGDTTTANDNLDIIIDLIGVTVSSLSTINGTANGLIFIG